jgi:hypothetical protein
MRLGTGASEGPKMASSSLYRAGLGLLLALGATLATEPAQSRETRAPRSQLREIAQSAANIRMALRTARGDGDDLRARCISEKLSEVHAQQRLAERHEADLRASRDAHSARRHRYLLDAAAVYSHELTAEARHCGAPRYSSLRIFPPSGPRVATQ